MNKLRRFSALLIAAAMAFASVGCSKEVTAEDLMTNIVEGNASSTELDEKFCERYSVAAFNLLKNEYSQNSSKVVLSPLAVYFNLSMLSNGATGSTKDGLENMFGSHYYTGMLNDNMHSFNENLIDSDKAKLHFENALWFNSDKNVAPSEEFLTKAKTYYNLDAYKESFGKDAVTNINNWASNKTNMFSERIIKEMPADVPLYLVNTTLIEATWEKPVAPGQVFDAKFKTSSGNEQEVQMMSSLETIYLGNDYVDGFIKPYSGGNYAFLALIPKKDNDSSLINFISTLSGDSYYRELIKKRKDYLTVDANIPKFSCENNGEIKEMIDKVNLGQALNSQFADLKSIGTCDEKIYLGNIAVATGLSVTESGTNKGTGANVGNSDGGLNMIPVNLNRPFVFAVVDTKRYLPVIIGAVNAVKD